MLGHCFGLLKQQDSMHLWQGPLTLYPQSVVHVKNCKSLDPCWPLLGMWPLALLKGDASHLIAIINLATP